MVRLLVKVPAKRASEVAKALIELSEFSGKKLKQELANEGGVYAASRKSAKRRAAARKKAAKKKSVK